MNKTLEKCVSEACELFKKTFEASTFICESCGEIIFPKVTTNEHGIFIENKRTDIRGGKGNHCIKKNICEDCVRNNYEDIICEVLSNKG